ncbi:BZ3500_MvSof-1268-A1-R1_Chr6-3g09030 [Microbotryum saponariae]|uniref:BZ3500_MvSof-1268-A1-R1_Chr6-3g09030 protein n=1 Tax=Microbotryum saponariae TaxID=289078 RepID=A0A2X0NIB0_9BASI|nr:BZ3500_MvSof-1268-A1-R1_Chr6-3g09030 [Microbotryum saponariae]SDA07632.1 BZ3501_MvSof-1269-A2-R1_Chr6-2g08734 [Microbotryum saponariae]
MLFACVAGLLDEDGEERDGTYQAFDTEARRLWQVIRATRSTSVKATAQAATRIGRHTINTVTKSPRTSTSPAMAASEFT